MKKLFFALGLLLVIGLSTSTAHAQAYPYCTSPTSQPLYVHYGECVGDGNLGDFPYGDVDANFQSAQCTGGVCGQCFSGYVPDSRGYCDYGLCYGATNVYWMSLYVILMDDYYVNAIVGCTYNPYGKMFKQPVPLLKPEHEPAVEARWWTFAPVRS